MKALLLLRNGCLTLALLLATATGARAQAPDTLAFSAGMDDVLRPGDVVRLQIWREPGLSGEFPVNEDGVVVLPKIGSFDVTGESPESLEARVLESYRRYLRNPSISITFLRRVNILGAVRAPGLYPVDPTMTVADALALAGGSLPHGKPDRVELFRAGEKLTANITQHTRIEDLPIRSGDQLYVPERNWLERNSGLTATLISVAVTLVLNVIK